MDIWENIYKWDINGKFMGNSWDFIVIQRDINGIYHLVMTNIAMVKP